MTQPKDHTEYEGWPELKEFIHDHLRSDGGVVNLGPNQADNWNVASGVYTRTNEDTITFTDRNEWMKNKEADRATQPRQTLKERREQDEPQEVDPGFYDAFHGDW